MTDKGLIEITGLPDGVICSLGFQEKFLFGIFPEIHVTLDFIFSEGEILCLPIGNETNYFFTYNRRNTTKEHVNRFNEIIEKNGLEVVNDDTLL